MRFPDCTRYDMPQRSEPWHAIRADKLTASGFGSWLAEEASCRLTVAELKDMANGLVELKGLKTKGDIIAAIETSGMTVPIGLSKTSTDACANAARKIVARMSGIERPDEWEIDPNGPAPRNPSQWAIWHGIRSEDEARGVFQTETGLEVEEVGFMDHRSKAVGCSPDGLILGRNDGLEIKCPLPETHLRYLDEGVLPPEYRDQVHGSIAATGADGWHFFSWCGFLTPFHIYVARDEYAERMESGFWRFAKELKACRERNARRFEERRAAR